MKLAWWKIVTLLLLLYTFSVGLLLPLKPSLTNCKVVSYGENGQVTIEANLYRGKLLSDKDFKVWAYNKNSVMHPSGSPKATDDQSFMFILQGTKVDTNQTFNLVFENSQQRDTLVYAFSYQPLVSDSLLPDQNTNTIQARRKLTGVFGFPNRPNLYETIRNLFFHVPIWFAMMFMAAMSVFYSFRYLRKNNINDDLIAENYNKLAVLLGFLGLITGSMWARFTWGDWWVFDIKLNGAAMTVLIYVAYLVLRSSISDEIQKAKISSAYSIFAFFMMILFVMIVPRIYDSLHPGNGGNPGFNTYDLDSTLRMVFYAAVLGWMGLSLWISQLMIRYKKIKTHYDEKI